LVSAYQNSVSQDQFLDWGLYGFVTKFATDGSLAYSTYLSGSTLNIGSCTGCFPDSEILGVATDASGNAYVTGYTTTMDFPTTTGALTTAYPGYSLSDVGFVSKFDTSGSLVYSTYLAGQTSSFLNAIAVDSTGAAYVTGYDIANDSFPIVTTSICDPSSSACNGAVIAKLDPTGASLTYSTFLGMSNNMAGQAIQVDAGGDAFVVGSDIAFDLANPIEAYAGNGDVVVAGWAERRLRRKNRPDYKCACGCYVAFFPAVWFAKRPQHECAANYRLAQYGLGSAHHLQQNYRH